MYQDYFQIAVKLAVGAVVLLMYIHMLGKLAPMTAMDQVSNIVIGAIVSGMIYEAGISVLEFLLVVSAWAGMMLIFRHLKQKSVKAQDLIDGKPVQLVKDGHLLTRNFTGVKLTARDFISLLHKQSILGLNDIKSVWYEQTGQLTVLKKDEEPLAVTLVEDGRMNQANLALLARDAEWLRGELAALGAEDVKKVFYAEWTRGKVSAYLYSEE